MGRNETWKDRESAFMALVRRDSMVKMACFMRCSSPDCSHNGGSREMMLLA
jgi:hypothetical protein